MLSIPATVCLPPLCSRACTVHQRRASRASAKKSQEETSSWTPAPLPPASALVFFPWAECVGHMVSYRSGGRHRCNSVEACSTFQHSATKQACNKVVRGCRALAWGAQVTGQFGWLLCHSKDLASFQTSTVGENRHAPDIRSVCWVVGLLTCAAC